MWEKPHSGNWDFSPTIVSYFCLWRKKKIATPTAVHKKKRKKDPLIALGREREKPHFFAPTDLAVFALERTKWKENSSASYPLPWREEIKMKKRAGFKESQGIEAESFFLKRSMKTIEPCKRTFQECQECRREKICFSTFLFFFQASRIHLRNYWYLWFDRIATKRHCHRL